MRMRNVTFCLIVMLMMVLYSGGHAHAAVFFDDDFEVPSIENAGWAYALGYCNYNQPVRTTPCPYIDLGTALTSAYANGMTGTNQAHSGSRSVLGVYSAAWSDPNPQINEQALFKLFPNPTANLYTRYWYRTSNFTYSDPGTKHLYYKTNFYPNGYSANLFGSRELGIVLQVTSGICPTSGNGPYATCNYFPNMTHVPFNDGQWYCVEEHVNLGTPGNADGVVEIWVNGVQTLGYYNQALLVSSTSGPNGTSSLTTFSSIQIFKQNGDGLMYYDQVATGDTRIGCGSGAPPPAAPTGLSVR